MQSHGRLTRILLTAALTLGALAIGNATAHAGTSSGQIIAPYVTPPETVGRAIQDTGVPAAFQNATGLPLGQFIGVTGAQFVFQNDCDAVPLSNGVDSWVVRTTGSLSQITVRGTKLGSGYRFAVVGFRGGSCAAGAASSKYCGNGTTCTLTGATGTKFAYIYVVAPSGVAADAAAVTFDISWS